MEAGYAVWTFQGRQLFKNPKDKLFTVNWRPHPPTMISDAKQREIRKDIRKYSKKYDALDEKEKDTAREAFRKDRQERLEAIPHLIELILCGITNWTSK